MLLAEKHEFGVPEVCFTYFELIQSLENPDLQQQPVAVKCYFHVLEIALVSRPRSICRPESLTYFEVIIMLLVENMHFGILENCFTNFEITQSPENPDLQQQSVAVSALTQKYLICHPES